MCPDQFGGRVRIVIGAHHPGQGQVQPPPVGAEGKHAAVIAALERQHPLAARHRPRRLQGQQVRLRAGVGKTHPFQRRKTRAEQIRQHRLVLRRPAQGDAVLQRVAHGGPNARVGMAVEPGRLLRHEVGIAVAVQVRDMAAFAAGQHQRIGRVEQHRARVAAGHGTPGVAIGALAGRVRGAKTGFGLFQRGGDVEIAAGGPGGGRRMGGGHGEPRVVPSITAFWRRIRTHGKPLIALPLFAPTTRRETATS